MWSACGSVFGFCVVGFTGRHLADVFWKTPRRYRGSAGNEHTPGGLF